MKQMRIVQRLINRATAWAIASAAALPSIAFQSPVVAGPTLQQTLTRDIAGGIDAGLLIVPDGAGGMYVVGATPMFTGDEDIIVIRYDAAGAELWITLYDGVVAGGHDLPVDALVDAAGDLYITGESESLTGDVSPEWVTLKFAGPNGAKLWERRFHGSGTFGYAIPRDMAMGPVGEIVVTGWSRDDDTFGDFGVVKYTADGVETWSREFSSPGFQSDVAEAVAVGSDGGVVIAGIYHDQGDRIVGAVKYGAAGDFQWLQTYDASAFAGLEDRVQSVAIDGEDNIYVAADGMNNSTDGRDFVLLKYAPDGTLRWDRRVVGASIDIYPVVLIGPEGNVYVSGSISNIAHRLLAFDSAGNELWSTTATGAIGNDIQRDHVVIDAEGHVAVLVRTVPQPGVGAFTIRRYATDGMLVDQTTIDPAGEPRTPTGLAADAHGNIFATGWWQPSGHRDVLTYKLTLPAASDLNEDSVVDVFDLFMLLDAWGTDGAGANLAPPTGLVDVFDLFVMLDNWGG